MDQPSFEARIRSLPTKLPIRLRYLPSKFVVRDGHVYDNGTKDCGSIEWRNIEGQWEHLITVPRGNIYAFKHDGYRCQDYDHPHNSLDVVYRNLVRRGLVDRDTAHKYLLT